MDTPPFVGDRFMRCVAHWLEARKRALAARTNLDRAMAVSLAEYWRREAGKTGKTQGGTR